MKLICVRQGQTNANVEDLVQGHTDFSLNSIGRNQAEELHEFLSSNWFDIDAVYSSDLSRAVETAKIACPDYEIRTDDRFREQDFGEVVGSLSEYLDKNPEFRLTNEESFSRPFPDGESVRQVSDRVIDGLNDLLDAHESDETIVLICHFTPLLCLVSYTLGESLHETWSREHFENLETIVISEDDGELSIEERYDPTERQN